MGGQRRLLIWRVTPSPCGCARTRRTYLGSKQVDSGRMFIVAPKTDANGIKDQGKTTRVDLSLE